MKRLFIPLLFLSVSAFGQFTKPQLYTNINTNIRNKTASQLRTAAVLDSIVKSMALVSGGGMVYPSAGIAVSTGSAWGTSITDNSANWNDAMRIGATQTNTTAKTFLDGTFKLRNVANTFDAIFSNTNTANRTYTLQNASGTLAFTSDIPTLTASNGITKTGNNFALGGTLTGATTIYGSQIFSFGQFGGYLNQFNVASDNLDFRIGDSGGSAGFRLQVSATDAVFTDSNSGSVGGLRYAADYSGYVSITDRHIPDRGWVNNNFWKLSGTSTLTGAATIADAGNSLTFIGTGDKTIETDFGGGEFYRSYFGGTNGLKTEWALDGSNYGSYDFAGGLLSNTFSGVTNTVTFGATGLSLLGNGSTININSNGLIISTSGKYLTLQDPTAASPSLFFETGGTVPSSPSTGWVWSNNTNGGMLQHRHAGITRNFVYGPTTAVDNRVAFFDGTTGGLIKDSGLTLSGTNTGDQTITNTSDATSHTVTLSNSGGTVQLIEGSNITLTTGGTGAAGTVTIASTGGGGGDMLLGTSQTVTALKTFNAGTFALRNPANTFSYNFLGSAIVADRTVTLPLLTGNDTFVMNDFAATLTNKTIAAASNTITGLVDANIDTHTTTKISTTSKSLLNSAIVYTDQINTFGDFNNTFRSTRLRIANPANTFSYSFTGAAIAADRAITLPLLTSGDVMVTEAFGQTLTNKTVNLTSNTLSGTTAQFNAALSDGDFATGGGTATGTNTGDQTISVTGTTTATIDLSGDATDASITGAGISTVSVAGNAITITSTEVDGSTSNELQTITNSSAATTHTVTLSSTGGSVQLVEGSNITLTTTGTAADGIVTIAATGGGGMTDPMTTRGDIIIRDATNTTARLGIGSNTYVLTSNGTDVSWAAPSGGGSGLTYAQVKALKFK